MNYHMTFVLLFAAVTLSAQGQGLLARVEVAQSGTNFNYTVYNDEAVGSARYLASWHLELNSPFQIISTPPGWDYMTDHSTYVSWFSKDSEEPFPSDIAPGAALSGFGVAAVVSTSERLSFAVTSWQHGTASSGPSLESFIKSPSVLSFKATIVNLSYAPGNLQFTVQGLASLQYSVEVSTNLVDWTYVMTGASPFTYRETAPASAGARFFRATYVDTFGWASDSAE